MVFRCSRISPTARTNPSRHGPGTVQIDPKTPWSRNRKRHRGLQRGAAGVATRSKPISTRNGKRVFWGACAHYPHVRGLLNISKNINEYLCSFRVRVHLHARLQGVGAECPRTGARIRSLGASWDVLRASWGALAALGASWGRLGATLGRSWPDLGSPNRPKIGPKSGPRGLPKSVQKAAQEGFQDQAGRTIYPPHKLEKMSIF